jgi:hypothetical protein
MPPCSWCNNYVAHLISEWGQAPPPPPPWHNSPGPRLCHCQSFEITLRHTTLSRTPSDKWSAIAERDWDTAVNIVTHYGLHSLGFVSVEARNFLFLIPIQNSPGAYSASCTMGTEILSPELTQLGYGTDHPYSPSTEVKNE